MSDKPNIPKADIVKAISVIKTVVLIFAAFLVLSWSVTLVFVTGQPDIEDSRAILLMNGYTSIKIVDHKFGDCAPVDYFRTGFIAESAFGYKVSGTVCGTWAKSFIIRLYPTLPPTTN